MITQMKSHGLNITYSDFSCIYFECQSIIIQLQAILLRHSVPVELLRIVENYFGPHGSAEAFIYPIISKIIHSANSIANSNSKLPFSNISTRDFTYVLKSNYLIGLGYVSSDKPISLGEYYIDPLLFYKYYKLIH